MATLDELVHYCRIEHTIGSLVLVGESGCGKTYLIERDLKEALKDTHFIVRVSLFGVNSISALHDAIKKQWLYTLTPLLSKLSSHPDQMEKGRSFVRAVNSILQTIYPQAGNLSSAMLNSLEYVVVTPVVEDHITKKEKRVVLVFDDVDRTMLNWAELLGCINDYCENQHFNTIVIANREYFSNPDPSTADFIRAAREKTVAYTVLNRPDFEKIVHDLVEGWNWKNEEYAEFLREHERTILELFASENPVKQESNAALIKNHNIRGLITSLESFLRIYHHMLRAEISDLDPYFCSFIAFSLAEKSGVFKDGKTTYTFTDEEVKELYPLFSADCLFDSVREWIRFGDWNKSQFMEELSRISTVDLAELMKEEEEVQEAEKEAEPA
ncbi:MAG: ATP-binding protein [Oscillospiraceae bacterium]|nr:ATP-binding protein [Oscillospiraceae bacterium]